MGFPTFGLLLQTLNPKPSCLLTEPCDPAPEITKITRDKVLLLLFSPVVFFIMYHCSFSPSLSLQYAQQLLHSVLKAICIYYVYTYMHTYRYTYRHTYMHYIYIYRDTYSSICIRAHAHTAFQMLSMRPRAAHHVERPSRRLDSLLYIWVQGLGVKPLFGP